MAQAYSQERSRECMPGALDKLPLHSAPSHSPHDFVGALRRDMQQSSALGRAGEKTEGHGSAGIELAGCMPLS